MTEATETLSSFGDLKSVYEARAAARAAQNGTPPKEAAPQTEAPEQDAVTSPYADVGRDEVQAEENHAEEVATAPEGGDDFLPDAEGDSPDITKLKAQLRAGYNRKMNELDQKLKSMDSDEIATLKQKAQALDALLNSPNAEEALKAARMAGGAPAQQGPQQVFQPRMMGAKFEELGLHEAVREPIEDAMDAYLEAKLVPMLMPYVGWIQSQVANGAQSQWTDLSQKYGPESEDYKNKAYEIASRAQISLEQALIAASNGQLVAKQKAREVERKTTAQTVRSNGVAANNKGPGNYKTQKQELVRLLLKADRESGRNQFLTNKLG